MDFIRNKGVCQVVFFLNNKELVYTLHVSRNRRTYTVERRPDVPEMKNPDRLSPVRIYAWNSRLRDSA